MNKKKKYTFDAIKHHHSLDGKPLYGVTTALGVIAKPFLIPWASKMAVEEVRRNWKVNKQYTRAEREAILEVAQKAHNTKKVAGGNAGTSVHALIEDEINNAIKNNKGRLLKKNKKSYDINDDGSEQIHNFIDWSVENKVQFIASEQHVHSETHWYGGIVDFVCIINNKRFVGDIKTSSGIFPEHFLQMGAYDICLIEMGEPKADGYVIVNLQKCGVIRTKQFTDTKKFKTAFLNALELYKALKTMKWNNYY